MPAVATVPAPKVRFHIQTDTQGPDHHPLKRAEVVQLLEKAKTVSTAEQNSIQIRLCQGIPGYRSPRPDRGPVARKSTDLGHLYVDAVRAGLPDIPALADRIMVLYR